MPKIDEILKLLENGKWHNLTEIEKKTQLHNFDITTITKFLAQYNFIKLDRKGQKAKLDPSTQHFLKKIRQIEGEENFKQL